MPTFHEHHDEDAKEHQNPLEHGSHGSGEVLGDVVDVVGDAGKDVSELVGIEVRKRQDVDLLLNGRAEIPRVIVRYGV